MDLNKAQLQSEETSTLTPISILKSSEAAASTSVGTSIVAAVVILQRPSRKEPVFLVVPRVHNALMETARLSRKKMVVSSKESLVPSDTFSVVTKTRKTKKNWFNSL